MIGREKRRKRNHGIFFSHAFCSFFHHFTECINLLSINPYILRFASGKARSTVSFRNVLETRYIFDKEKLVTEYIVDCIDELALPPRCSSENNDIEEKSSSHDKYITNNSNKLHDKYTTNKSNESRDKNTTNNNSNDASPLVEARYSLAPKKLFDNNMADNDYYNSQQECDENSGIAGNSKAPRDPPIEKKIGRRGSFSNLTGFSPSIKTIGESRDPP